MSHTFLVLGEALTDAVVRDGQTVSTPGGSPMNVAVGLGRLGHDVVLGARWGDDQPGASLLAHVTESGVHAIAHAGEAPRTSRAEATVGQDGAAHYDFDLLWDLTPEMVPPGNYHHVHAGSIGATLEPGASAVVEIMTRERRSGASVSYDPNIRPAIMGTPATVLGRIEELIARSDIVKASDDDIVWLYPGVTRDEVIVHWQSLGPSLVIITQGGAGVTAATGRHRIVLAAAATTIVDTIGAGDSFMSGLLSALAERHALGSGADSGAGKGAGNGAGTALAQMSKKDLSEVIGFALECAAITVSRAGANPPTRIELGPKR